MAEVKPKVEGKVKTPRLEMMFVLSAHITSAIQVHIVNGIPLVIFFFFIDKELLLFKASSPLAVIMPLLEKFVYTPLFAGSGSS